MRTVRYARRINHIPIGDRIESRWLTTEVHSNAAFERSNSSAATKIGIRMSVRESAWAGKQDPAIRRVSIQKTC